MARDKSKDDRYFSCEQEHELKYVSSLYKEQQIVYNFLKQKCQDNTIKYFTHQKVYKLILDKLGYPIPI